MLTQAQRKRSNDVNCHCMSALCVVWLKGRVGELSSSVGSTIIRNPVYYDRLCFLGISDALLCIFLARNHMTSQNLEGKLGSFQQ